MIAKRHRVYYILYNRTSAVTIVDLYHPFSLKLMDTFLISRHLHDNLFLFIWSYKSVKISVAFPESYKGHVEGKIYVIALFWNFKKNVMRITFPDDYVISSFIFFGIYSFLFCNYKALISLKRSLSINEHFANICNWFVSVSGNWRRVN